MVFCFVDREFNMGYFDGLADNLFKMDSSGKTLFYPYGSFGSGIVIESEEKKNQVRGFVKKTYFASLLVIIIIGMTVGYWLNFALLPVYYGWYYFIVKKVTKDLPKSTEKLKISESLKNSAKSHNLSTLILGELCSIGFVGVGFFILQKGQNQHSPIVGLASIGFFGLCGISLGYMIFAKLRE